MEIEQFGRLPVEKGNPGEYLSLTFCPLNAPLRSRWRNNGLSADFLGDYAVTFLPGNGGDGLPADTTRNEVRHAVSYVANELLENAMKYHEKVVGLPITIRLELSSDYVTIVATNGVTDDQANAYRVFIKRFLSEDPVALMMERLETPGKGEEEASGLGLLTIRNDYSADLGWEFIPQSESAANLFKARTCVMIPLQTVSGASK